MIIHQHIGHAQRNMPLISVYKTTRFHHHQSYYPLDYNWRLNWVNPWTSVKFDTPLAGHTEQQAVIINRYVMPLQTFNTGYRTCQT